MLRTSHEWIDKLAAKSMVIANMQLETVINNVELRTEAFNLANCDIHCQLIARAIDELVNNNFSSAKDARNLLCNLFGRNVYGCFAELAAYDWLARCHVRIATQISMPPSDVLSKNGSTLDGQIDLYDHYFDVKAFGSNGRLAQLLKERLAEATPDEQVIVEESWDISFETFSDLIRSAPDIAIELKEKRMVKYDRLCIRLEAKKLISVTARNIDPYYLAKENALYPFKDAGQFTKTSPFILIFVIHPWFNACSIQSDFAGVDTNFTRSLARRAFMQFSTDSTPLNSICENVPSSITIGDASRLLSAIFFVNVWPLSDVPSWLYLNPRATHRITRGQLNSYRASNPHNTYIDDFADDDY